MTDMTLRERIQSQSYPNLLTIINAFMRTGGQTTTVFNADQATLYVGLVLEEVAEMMLTIAGGCVSRDAQDSLEEFAGEVTFMSDKFKRGLHMGDLMRCDRFRLVDDLIDTAWVALGGVFSVAHDTAGAVGEVGRANLDKYPGGVVTRDANGKVMKPAGWRPPDLSRFVAQPEKD